MISLAYAVVALCAGITGVAVFFYGDLRLQNRSLRASLKACRLEADRMERELEVLRISKNAALPS